MSVSIIMGSNSDRDRMEAAAKALAMFGVESTLNVMSAHRTPELVRKHIKNSVAQGTKIFICGAGMAAHLAGAVAGLTTRPVIGVPLSGSALKGNDSLLSTVQMPKGIPVATVAIDGAFNAGLLAVQMLAISDDALAKKMDDYRQEMAAEVEKLNQ